MFEIIAFGQSRGDGHAGSQAMQTTNIDSISLMIASTR